MNFILKMAWRDSRSARRRLLLFSLSIVLGIAALVAIGSFTDNLRRAVDSQAKALLGADLAVESRVVLSDEARAFLDGLGGEQAQEVSFASMVVFPNSGGQTRLISLRATEGAYPFYGDFVTDPGGAPDLLRAGEEVAVLEETLMAQYGARIGDPVRVGQKTFRIVGALKKIPGDSAAVAMLSPRVYIARSQLAETGLLGPGALVRYKTYFKFSDDVDVEKLVRDLRGRFRELRLGFDTVEERKRDLGRALRNVDAFLSLIGFVALFLGAIGVAGAVHGYIRQKIATVAVLRCLGASAAQTFAVYLMQGIALGLFGAVVGAAAGVAVQLLLPELVRGMLPVDVTFAISWTAVVRGMLAGLAVCVLFTLLPLLAVRRVSPLVALRSAFVEQTGWRDPWRIALYVLIALAVTAFAMVQTRSWATGAGFAGALIVCIGVLALLARLVAWLARRFLPKRLPYVWRQGVANLYRPQNRTVLLLLSLGLGTFLLLSLTLTRETVLAQVRGTGGGERPNLLFFDIQDDQVGPLTEILAKEGTPVRAQAPIVTMRLRALKGRPVEAVLREQGTIPAWTLRREYRSTFRSELSDTEKLIAGEFVGRVDADAEIIPISVEEGLARDMQLSIGDELEWDVQGVPMRTRVASLRSVEWQRMSPNFFVVFPAGPLDEAPKFHVMAARAESPESSARVQQAVVSALPNVSAIDLALLLQTLDGIFSKVELVVRFIALFTVATGVIVLAGAVLSGRFQRIRETVLLRTLGASRGQIARIQLVEYAVLGALAALTGGALAFGASALMAMFVFEAPVVVPLGYLAVTVACVVAVTLLTGWIANRGIATHPPLAVLREEA
jgi:Predicted ABC-type transport system involved in lysophospholipase L1 biosynthesis, permease component